MSCCKLCSQDVSGVPSGTVRLVSNGYVVLNPSGKISDYGIEEGDTIEVYKEQCGC